MNTEHHNRQGISAPRQQGTALLIGLLILIVMTLMTLFAVNISIFEQRASGNEYRAKQSFSAAEAGIGASLEVIKSASRVFTSPDAGGWFNAGSQLWQPCANFNSGVCARATDELQAMGGQVYFYDDADDRLPIPDPATMSLSRVDPAGTAITRNLTFDVSALICVVQADGTCATVDEDTETTNVLVQLDSTGSSDDSIGQSLVSVTVAPFRLLNATVDAPIVVANSFTGNGNFTVVPNPNGGGPGVPLSIWSDADVDMSSGSAQTCGLAEFYATGNETEFDGITVCEDCGCPGTELEYTSSDGNQSNYVEGIDILDADGGAGDNPDTTNFPADVFEYVFNEDRDNWKEVYEERNEDYDTCNSLGPAAFGLIWVDSDCTLNSNLSSPSLPALIVISDSKLSINGGGVLYGLVYLFDCDDSDADCPGGTPEIKLNGTATVYGAVVSDVAVDIANGTMRAIYNEDVLKNLSRDPSFSPWGPVPGTWNDFVNL